MDRRYFLKAGAVGFLPSVFLKSLRSNAFAASSKEVHVGVIGTGSRGRYLLKIMLDFPGWRPTAMCDINDGNLELAIKMVEAQKGYRPECYSKGPVDYKRMLERDDIDAVLIAAPAGLHAQMSVDSMLAGKHVGVEVPAAYALEECWELVNIKEKTGLHYMLLEKSNYMRKNMMVLNMVKQNIFGKIYFGECTYIHDLSNLLFDSQGNLTWRAELKRGDFGNLYPTHTIGPVAKWLNINQGDRFVRLTSYMSKPIAMHEYAIKRFGKDSPAAKVDFKAGDMCSMQIQTHSGALINIQYDLGSSRPINNYYLLQGTKGLYDGRNGIYLKGISKGGQWDPVSQYYSEYDHPLWQKEAEEASEPRHDGSDFFMMREFIESLIENREPWIDVYDAVAWSAIMELSQQSILNNNAAVDFPDFTRGKWKNKSPHKI